MKGDGTKKITIDRRGLADSSVLDSEEIKMKYVWEDRVQHLRNQRMNMIDSRNCRLFGLCSIFYYLLEWVDSGLEIWFTQERD